MSNTAYQPTQTTTVVVPTQRSIAPYYIRQGVKVGGFALGLPCVICLGVFGVFFLFGGIMALATANYNDDFWDKFDRQHDPTVAVGGVFLTIGLLLTVGCIALCFFAKRKYREFQSMNTNPGRIITPSPGQPSPNPGQPAVYPGQPAVYPGQPNAFPGQPAPVGQPGGMNVTYQYTPPGQAPPLVPAPTGYPSAPTGNPTAPAGYPTAPAGYPTAPAGYPIAPAGYPIAPAGYPTAPAGYPNAPAGYPNAPTGYPTDPAGYPPPTTDYPVKGEQPPPYQP